MKEGVIMRVPVYTGVKTIVFQDKPIPDISPEQALVKVEYAGLCGSDIHAYARGKVVAEGTVLGHECSGVVTKVGAEVRNFQVGDRVWVRPYARCNECEGCQRKGRCLRILGGQGVMGITLNYDGAFAEYVLIKSPDGMLFKLPPNVSFEEAALVEPLSVSLHAVRASQMKVGDSVVVAGAGMIGLGVLQFVRLGGAGKIIVLETSAVKSRLAAEMGADVVLNPISEGDGLAEKILNLTNRTGPDLVFECAGVASALKSTINYVSSGGRIIGLGLHEEELSFDFFSLVNREVKLEGVVGYFDEFKHVLNFFEQKLINGRHYISDVISLADIDEKGFKRALTSPDMIKILVRP
jgi:threonine dehydrogenase-like Zn-dependent dehydrogenase